MEKVNREQKLNKTSKFFVVRLRNGYMTIVIAKRQNCANKWAREFFGIDKFVSCQPATEADVNWVKSFGGKIHEY